jgi:hypothetical protein
MNESFFQTSSDDDPEISFKSPSLVMKTKNTGQLKESSMKTRWDQSAGIAQEVVKIAEPKEIFT